VGRRAPRFKHRNLRTHVFKKLTANPALVGLIYQGDVRRLLHYHQAAADRPELAFYEASEAGFLHRPGAWGVISAGAQLDPQTWAQLTQACLHPELTETLEDRQLLWDKSSRLLKLAELCQPAPPALLKAALAAQGIFACEATAPDTPPAPAALREQFLQAVR
jgi:dihydrodipicolinate synthase/N-acetylneuraminate lyase